MSTRICVPNLVAVRRSCRKEGGGSDRQTDRQTDIQTDKRTLQLYIIYKYDLLTTAVCS